MPNSKVLTADQAKELEKRAWERLGINTQPDKLTKVIMQCSVRATIATLQEYERMQEEKRN